MTKTIKKYDSLTIIIFVSFIVLDFTVWWNIFSNAAFSTAHAYFLDVGQGDSELLIFPGNVKVMTDAGVDDKVMESLEKVLAPEDSYIDVAVVSHPQLDHFNGYNYILDHYQVGVFIYNGRDDDPGVKEWPELLQKIKEKNIPLITLGAGDSIHYQENQIDILSPEKDFDESAELNDTGLVERITTPEFTTLLTADIGFNIEDFLIMKGVNIRADVLKVPHHGSKYSSSDAFLAAVDPKAAIIEVGVHNTYGHPSDETLARIASSTNAAIFRTDQEGTVEVWVENGKLKVKKEK